MLTAAISASQARDILERIKKVRIAVVGDMCLDAYWQADMQRSILSNETPHFPLPVVSERYSPGGGANVAANVAALGVRSLLPLAIVGDDWRGQLLRQEMHRRGIDCDGFITATGWRTTAYCKPLRRGLADVVYEDPRIDFENDTPPPAAATEALLAAIKGLAATVDAIAVSDQCRFGCVTDPVRAALCELAQTLPVIVDSRERVHLYEGAIIKPNENEAGHCFGISLGAASPPQSLTPVLTDIHEKTKAPLIITLGEQGSVCFDGQSHAHAPAFRREPPIDIVGAGDTFLAAVTAALGAGLGLAEAVCFGNAAAAVTVKKIGTTGTASPDEILSLWPDNLEEEKNVRGG